MFTRPFDLCSFFWFTFTHLFDLCSFVWFVFARPFDLVCGHSFGLCSFGSPNTANPHIADTAHSVTTSTEGDCATSQRDPALLTDGRCVWWLCVVRCDGCMWCGVVRCGGCVWCGVRAVCGACEGCMWCGVVLVCGAVWWLCVVTPCVLGWIYGLRWKRPMPRTHNNRCDVTQINISCRLARWPTHASVSSEIVNRGGSMSVIRLNTRFVNVTGV